MLILGKQGVPWALQWVGGTQPLHQLPDAIRPLSQSHELHYASVDLCVFDWRIGARVVPGPQKVLHVLASWSEVRQLAVRCPGRTRTILTD